MNATHSLKLATHILKLERYRDNECIKTDLSSTYYHYFSQKTLHLIDDFFKNNGKMRNWEDLRVKLGLDDNK